MPAATTVAQMAVVVTADTSAAESSLGQLNTKVTSAGSAISTAFAGAAVAGAVGLAAGLTACVTSAADFEKTMSGVKAVSGATSDEMAALSAKALELGAKTSFSASEAGKGLEELVKGGLTVGEAMTAAEATLNLAAAGGISVADAATIAANALAQFNMPAEQMAHVSDLIAGAANASALDVGQFKFSLEAAGAVAATVGFSFDDLSQAIAVMGKAGITGSDAGTSLKTMMMNLSPQTKKAKEEMQDLGIIGLNTSRELEVLKNYGIDATGKSAFEMQATLQQLVTGWNGVGDMTKAQTKTWEDAQGELNLYSNAFFDASGNVKSMAEVAGVLQTATAGLTNEQKLNALQTMFGSDAVRAGAVLAKAGAEGFNDMAAAMGKVTAESVGAEKLNNLMGSVEQLKGSLETMAITIGIELLPLLKDFADWLTQAANSALPMAEAAAKSFAATLQAWKPTLEALAVFLWDNRDAIIAVVAALATFALLTTVIGWVTAIAGAIGAVTAAISASGGVLAALGALVAILGGPVTLIIAAVALAVAALSYAWMNNWGDIQGKTAAVVEFLSGVPDAVSGFFTDIGHAAEGLQMAVEQAWDAITTATGDLVKAVSDAWDSIKAATVTVWNSITQFLTDWWREILVALTGPIGLLAVFIIDNWETIKTGTETIFRAIANLLTAIWDEIYTTIIQPKLEAISTFIATTWDTISGAVNEKVTAISTFLAETWEAIRGAIDATMQAVATLISAAWEATKTATTTILTAILTYVRDTIFEPLRAAIAEKIDAARALVEAAWTAISTAAHTALDPLVAYIRDTIFTPIKTTVETVSTAIKTAFTGAVDAVKTTVDTTMSGIKSTWETIWKAIEMAATSPKAALDELIGLIDKLKKIMPDWLIPHSPTPFQIGIEGIAKAATAMGKAFTAAGPGIALINQIAELATSIGGDDFGRAAAAIAASETGGGKTLVEQGGTGAQGPFQFDPGGELPNFAKALGVSVAEAARVAITDPMKAASWALHGYLGHALKAGQKEGLSGAELAMYGSRYGQRPFGDYWKRAGEWYQKLYGMAEGGIVTRPTMALIGERGPEAVIPLSSLGGAGTGIGGVQHIVIDVAIGGRIAEQIYVTGRDLAMRRGRSTAGVGSTGNVLAGSLG